MLHVWQVAFKPELLMQGGNLLVHSYFPNTLVMMIFAVSSLILTIKFVINVHVGVTGYGIRVCVCVYVYSNASYRSTDCIDSFISGLFLSVIARDEGHRWGSIIECRRARVNINVDIFREIQRNIWVILRLSTCIAQTSQKWLQRQRQIVAFAIIINEKYYFNWSWLAKHF